MSVTLRDPADAAALAAATGQIEVRGPAGRVLGRFTPHVEFKLTDQQVLDRMNRPGARWHTPDEVMARLRQIGERGR